MIIMVVCPIKYTQTVEYNGTSVDVIIDKPYGTSLDVLIVYHGTVEYNTEIYNAASSTLNQQR